MKPTITANLSGTEFIFDTDAYALMEQYLRSLREAFNARGLDTNDLLVDIENRCVEILGEPRDDGSRIVTITQVRNLIERMGQPQEIFEDDGVTPPPIPPTTSSTPVTPPPIRKRLYRDPHSKLLGGVCSGFAIYCGWDPVWVRLATVGLALLSFSTMTIIYVILWIVLRPAKTPYQQMQLRGVSPTLQNIGNAVTGTFRSVKNYMTHPAEPALMPVTDVDAGCEFEQLTPHPKPQKATGAKRFAQIITVIASVIMKGILILYGLLSIPILIGLVTALIAMICLPDFFLVNIANEMNDPVNISIIHNIPMMMWILVSAIVFFAIPAIAMVWLLCRLFMGRRAKAMPMGPKIVMLVVWLGSLFSLAICAEILDYLPFM